MGKEIAELPVKTKKSVSCPVNSYTEWGLLEEVIVGVVNGAHFPPWHIALEAVLPRNQHQTFEKNAAKPFPAEQIQLANCELDEFTHP